jgi:hypothetical protein
VVWVRGGATGNIVVSGEGEVMALKYVDGDVINKNDDAIYDSRNKNMDNER